MDVCTYIYIYIYMYLVKHKNAFIALVATSFGRYDHNQDSAIQNLKSLVTPTA
jgi:hypothetical protein